MNKILLDTNAYTRLLSGGSDVLDCISQARTIYLSVFVLGELHAGFAGGNREQNNREILENFLRKPAVKILNATAETAELFGQLKNTLKRAGTPLPINDLWIGTHALETGSVLVTFDNHFRCIPGLRLMPKIL